MALVYAHPLPYPHSPPPPRALLSPSGAPRAAAWPWDCRDLTIMLACARAVVGACTA